MPCHLLSSSSFVIVECGGDFMRVMIVVTAAHTQGSGSGFGVEKRV